MEVSTQLPTSLLWICQSNALETANEAEEESPGRYHNFLLEDWYA